ncbi:molybdopterin-dependent oxidoreductase [Aeromicrobium sp. CF3.5]|uniref:molybdopterin-dependent oxidoreductase n=1 Tax=Aeromicrobium sp. CF3.5 TaxID=3373078 RepID=UPI003EE67778
MADVTTETATPQTAGHAPRWAGALSGILAASLGLALGTLLAKLLTGVPTPINTVGNRAIDFAPPFLKDFAIEQFGTADKAVLIGGVVATLAIVALVVGAIGVTKPKVAQVAMIVLGVVAFAAALFDRTASANIVITVLPTLLTGVVAFAAITFLLRRMGTLKGEPGSTGGFERRAFLIGAFGIAAVAAIGGGLTRVFGGAAARESRAAITLPAAAQTADAIPAGAQIDLKGISPYITPNKDFYRIDTALSVPDVPTDGYVLRIHGMVDRELNLTYQDLLDMPLEEHRVTLTCVSNEVGGPYVGNATWLGIRTSTLLEMAGVQSGADAVLSTSADGWDTGTPLEALTDDRSSLVAVGMNGEPLPLIHGFPVRMVVPGLYGYVSATKWLVDIEVSRFQDFTAYWTSRDYTAEAPIKFSSRIDVPASFEALPIDNARVGGVAWAQTVGIAKVEVKIDDGGWNEAELGASDTDETWRQWSWTWDEATEGRHNITVRATTKDGETQTSDRAPIRPNGTTGWHSVQFRVE